MNDYPDGLSNAVTLALPGAATRLLWCDGAWSLLTPDGKNTMPLWRMPKAATVQEAQRAGRAWIAERAEQIGTDGGDDK